VSFRVLGTNPTSFAVPDIQRIEVAAK